MKVRDIGPIPMRWAKREVGGAEAGMASLHGRVRSMISSLSPQRCLRLVHDLKSGGIVVIQNVSVKHLAEL